MSFISILALRTAFFARIAFFSLCIAKKQAGSDVHHVDEV